MQWRCSLQMWSHRRSIHWLIGTLDSGTVPIKSNENEIRKISSKISEKLRNFVWHRIFAPTWAKFRCAIVLSAFEISASRRNFVRNVVRNFVAERFFARNFDELSEMSREISSRRDISVEWTVSEWFMCWTWEGGVGSTLTRVTVFLEKRPALSMPQLIPVDLTLLLPRMINFKFPLQPHQKYYITRYEEPGFS